MKTLLLLAGAIFASAPVCEQPSSRTHVLAALHADKNCPKPSPTAPSSPAKKPAPKDRDTRPSPPAHLFM